MRYIMIDREGTGIIVKTFLSSIHSRCQKTLIYLTAFEFISSQ